MPDAPGAEPRSEYERLPPMALFVVGFLRRPAQPPPLADAEAAALQERHMRHLRELVESGEILLVGPFAEDTDLRGMVVFRTESLDHARELMRDDPAVRAGRLVFEFGTWFTSASLAGLGVPPMGKGPNAAAPPG